MEPIYLWNLPLPMLAQNQGYAATLLADAIKIVDERFKVFVRIHKAIDLASCAEFKFETNILPRLRCQRMYEKITKRIYCILPYFNEEL